MGILAEVSVLTVPLSVVPTHLLRRVGDRHLLLLVHGGAKYRNDLLLMKALYDVLEKLANGTILPKEYKAHVLIGKYKDCMECHIKSNFLLIWIDTEHDVIEIVRIGSHSELF